VLVNPIADATEAPVVSNGMRRQRLVHRGERDGRAERLLDGSVDVPYPQRPPGLLENVCHSLQDRALAATKRAI